MQLESIRLSEISQSEKDNFMISLVWNLRNKTEDHRGKEEKNKTRQNQRGRQTIRDTEL